MVYIKSATKFLNFFFFLGSLRSILFGWGGVGELVILLLIDRIILLNQLHCFKTVSNFVPKLKFLLQDLNFSVLGKEFKCGIGEWDFF